MTEGNGAKGTVAGIGDVLDGLNWRCIGPHRGGRVVAVAGDPRDPMVFYFGACAGGVWKTVDGGTYWENVSDGFFNTAAIGALQVSDSDPNLIYAGTGETTIRGNVSHGDGVYKSTDAGKTWTNVGLRDTRHIAKIRIHPQNPDLVYVAALGHAFGPNEERGVFRSRDGGATWEKILYRSDRAGAVDLSMDPNNPRVLYATMWEAQRSPHSLNSGGPGSGLFKSTDGGDTWTEITRNPGLPKGIIGKIGVAVSPAQSGRVWALVEARDGALFRSDDGGETWERLSEEGGLRRRAWYYTHVFADPQDAETVWVLNLQCWKSIDGGRTFVTVPTMHGDNHDLWIDPRNSLRMIEGNDGGAQVTFNGAASWSTLYNQPTAQFYHVTTDTRVPYRVYGSQQDNSALSLPSLSLEGALTAREWVVPGGGESGYIAVRPDNPDIVFGGAIGSGFGNGLLWRYDHATKDEHNITVWPEITGMAEGADQLKYRFQWTFPVLISPHDPNVLYIAGNRLFRSTNEGMSWDVISPDLTRNDPSKLVASGGPITRDNTGAEVYCTIFAFEESPHQKGLFWAGTDDGLVHISRDGGQNWESITPPDLPEWALISIIALSPHDPATAYLAATRYKLDDTRPYLYKTNDYGKTWRVITNGIPGNDFTRVIREDPERRGLLYAGTETGLYISFDDGESWQRMGGNLPVAPIHDLVIKGDDLVVATHGRSFWILNDLAVLRQLAEDSAVGGSPRLFQPRPVDRYRLFQWFWNTGPHVSYSYAGPINFGYKQKKEPDGTVKTTYLDAGENPPTGAFVRYFLPEKPEGDITLTFLDGEGKEIRSFSSKKEKPSKERDEEEAEAGALALGVEGMEGLPAQAAVEEGEDDKEQEPKVPKEQGMNYFLWDLRYPDAVKIPKDKSVEYFLFGPTVMPGTYAVRLTVGDQSWTQQFEVRPDPRGITRTEDLQAQFDLLLNVRDRISDAHTAVNGIRDVKGQLDAWAKRLKGRDDAKSVLDSINRVKSRLGQIESSLVQEKAESPLEYPEKLNAKMASLVFAVDFSNLAPTQQAHEVYEKLAGEIKQQVDEFNQLVESDLRDLNRQIRDLDLPLIAPATAAAETREPAGVASTEQE